VRRGHVAVTPRANVTVQGGRWSGLAPRHRPAARATLAFLLVLGCAPGGAGGNKTADAIRATSAAATSAASPLAPAFDPGPAQTDSGSLHLQFYVPRTDNRGTCEAPEPDSTYPGDPVWARVFRERRVHLADGTAYDETHADSFWVRRGATEVYWRRVVPDSYLVNVRLYKGTRGSCRVYKGVVVTPSTPPTPVLVGP
jgi:hypothetical protein